MRHKLRLSSHVSLSTIPFFSSVCIGRRPVSLSHKPFRYPGAAARFKHPSPISEKHLRTLSLGSHPVVWGNSSTICPDSYFHPNWQIVNPKAGCISPKTQQFCDRWLTSIGVGRFQRNTQCDPGAGAGTLHHNQKPCFIASFIVGAGAPCTQNLTIQPHGTSLYCKCPVPHPAVLFCLIFGKQKPEHYVVKNGSKYSTHRAKAVYHNPLVLMSA